MDVDEPANFFEFVADDFEKGEHEQLDKKIHALFPQVTSQNLENISPYILLAIAEDSGGRFFPKYCNITECKSTLDIYPDVQDMILDGSKNGYQKLRLLKLLRSKRASPVGQRLEYTDVSYSPPLQGWRDAYVGDGAIALWEHIVASFEMTNPRVYAKYCPVVQSSGMGKSRAVDEISKSHFVIPVNLLPVESSGYPPGDQPACDYLKKTTHVVKPMAKNTVAEQFREKMTAGMLRNRHSEWRTNFYKEVVNHAEEYFHRGDLSGQMVDGQLLSSDFPLRKIFRYLRKVLESNQPSENPSVVLAFDEIHTMAKSEHTTRKAREWSRFGEILRAIRGLVDESLVTLFLSVYVAIFPTPVTQKHGPLSGMTGMPPFCELGFDQLAVRIDSSQAVTLSQITSIEHLISYGRPLWRPYIVYPHLQLMGFATVKLFGGLLHSPPFTDEENFACLARRIPIDFLSALRFSQVSEQEKDQVLYMRVILMAEDNFNTMVTVSSSEPILSKAAYDVMASSQFSPPQALQAIINKFPIYKDNIRELIVALLFTMARDKAINLAGLYDPPEWCSVMDLLGSLFCAPLPASENHVDIATSHGWRFSPDGTSQLKLSLADRFKDSKVYFTHFIKAHEEMVVKLDFLTALMLRGAAILCSNGPPGEEIRPDNIGVIIFQVDNDPMYTDRPEAYLLRRMESQIPEIIHPSANIPAIRLFFALGANTPALQRVEHESSYKSMENYSAYDFWVSGLSPKILHPVVNEEAAWKSILDASYTWKEVYSDLGEVERKLLMSMTPGVSTEAEFWENWCEEVP